jgi:hypothetical protein
MLKYRLLALIAVLVSGSGALADELLMKNGSRIIGTLVSAKADKVVFNTPFAGDITIKNGNIATIITDTDVTLLMKDGNAYRDKRIVLGENDLVAMSDDGPAVHFKVADVSMVNPEPWQLGDGYKWFGEANIVADLERGNTETDEYDVDFKSVWRSLEDRYTMRGTMEIDEANGEKNKDNWQSRNKYDRFSSRDADNYWGVQAAFAYDKFADLDLRTTVGPYIGRQFYDGSILDLSGEVGVVYVDEQFEVSEDDDFWGTNWELRVTSDIILKTELYLDQFGILNFDDIEGVLVDTVIGIKLPVYHGIQAAVEMKYEYDGGAVNGVDELDRTYNFKIGYSW